MSEYTVGWLGTAKLLLIVAFATLYWHGGRKHKFLRRFVGGAAFPAGVVALALVSGTFRWWHTIAFLSYPTALILGYGGDTLGKKIARRLLYGTVLGLASLPFALPQAFDLLTVQIALAITASIGLGVTSRIPAAEEEALIATFAVILVPFMV